MPPNPSRPLNIADYFLDDRIAEGKGERPALRTDREIFTYRQVMELANRFGHVLREEGISAGARVLIALPDGPEYVGALFGILKIGAVVVMVNPHLNRDEIAYLTEYSEAAIAIVHKEVHGAFNAAGPAPSGAQAEARRSTRLLVAGKPELRGRLAAAATALENHPTRPDDPAIWLFSGGTTGRPKAVVQPHASFVNTTECYAKGVIGYTESDVTLSVPKLYFGYATGANLLFPFSVGACAVLFPERTTPEVLFDKIETHRPTLLINVPTMIGRMLDHPGASRRDLSSLRAATSAGEALPAELHDRWKAAWDVELLDGLGTAEMWHIFLSNRPGEVRPGTLGRAVPGFEVRVCDDEGTELPPGETGRLWVRGGSLGLGYWKRDEETRAAFRGEWYASGDMVRCDEEGYVSYCGRADDMLKVSGKWLAPQEVENCLLAHPGVEEVAVVGVTDAHGLTRPHAFVVPASGVGGGGSGELERELRELVRERLSSYKVPRRILFRKELPRTHLGKIDRGRLRRESERNS